jgi:hypothetical protein
MAITAAVDICNQALAKIGAASISSLSDSSEEARVMNRVYERVRDDLLYSHPWNFAITRVAVAADATEPIYDWDNRFALPADCLRVIGTDLDNPQEWQVEGRFIVANAEELNIKYIAKIADVTKYSPGFVETLASKLAYDVCYTLVQSVTLRAQLKEEYLQALRTARTFDAQESSGDRVYADSWLNSRY